VTGQHCSMDSTWTLADAAASSAAAAEAAAALRTRQQLRLQGLPDLSRKGGQHVGAVRPAACSSPSRESILATL